MVLFAFFCMWNYIFGKNFREFSANGEFIVTDHLIFSLLVSTSPHGQHVNEGKSQVAPNGFWWTMVKKHQRGKCHRKKQHIKNVKKNACLRRCWMTSLMANFTPKLLVLFWPQISHWEQRTMLWCFLDIAERQQMTKLTTVFTMTIQSTLEKIWNQFVF